MKEKGDVLMPQLNKGGKFVFGLSLIHDDLTVQFPTQALEEYQVLNDDKIIIFTGSKVTGGFCVTTYPLLSKSKLSHILHECPQLEKQSIPRGTLVTYKGRKYAWLPLKENGSMTPFMWYVRFCKWLVYPTYDNGFNQKVAYTGGEVWGIRILAIVAVLFIVGILMVIIMETIKQYKKMWNEISQMFLIGSLSGIAVLGDVIRGYLPVNLILLFVFINVGIMLLIMYLRKSLITYSLTY